MPLTLGAAQSTPQGRDQPCPALLRGAHLGLRRWPHGWLVDSHSVTHLLLWVLGGSGPRARPNAFPSRQEAVTAWTLERVQERFPRCGCACSGVAARGCRPAPHVGWLHAVKVGNRRGSAGSPRRGCWCRPSRHFQCGVCRVLFAVNNFINIVTARRSQDIKASVRAFLGALMSFSWPKFLWTRFVSESACPSSAARTHSSPWAFEDGE